ncbi:EAL domain-containing protein [Mycobacterium sp. smrl_JER01]|uniref:EAL domain-containing protein n=1 Tax=Mycobacterium sp. smrl_JER01 TaxID=3402633 RepID=UPI003AC505D3
MATRMLGHPTAELLEVPVELVRTLLGTLRQRLGMEAAWLTVFDDRAQTVEVLDGDATALGISTGHRSSLSESYCVRVIDGRLPAVIPDTSANQITAAMPITHETGIAAYVGVPVRARGDAYVGMVCLASRETKPNLAEEDLHIVHQAADLVGSLIESPVRGPDPSSAQRKAIRRVVAEQRFEVVFQAVHEATTGKVMGVEALARFPCAPYRPDAFFEQAARLGLDLELERAVITRVLDKVPELPDDVFVAINISPAAALAVPWSKLLVDVDPSRIVLEITEHAAVPNYGALGDALQACRARGMRIAIDDVGAGFASFSHVLELGPDFVKIDQSITRNIDVDGARHRLARAIADFTGQIGVTVIAEGVESQGELDAIAAAGITWAQGYHLSRPKPHGHGFPTADVTAAASDRLPATVDPLSGRPFDLALAHSPIGMAVVGLDGTFMRTNRALRTMLGYSRSEFAKLTFQQITHPDDLEDDLALLAECLEGRRRTYHIDKRYLAADGRVVWCALTVVVIAAPHDRPRCFFSQVVDVTADRLREAELARRTATDSLTAIANRSTAWGRLERLEAGGTGFGVMLCDIEQFDAVVGRTGRHAGDHLLAEVSARLLAAVSDDDLVARWGGDEFLVVTDLCDDHGLKVLADRVAEYVGRAPVPRLGGHEVPIAITIGYAAHRPGDGLGIDAVLELAERARYEQRRNRRSA